MLGIIRVFTADEEIAGKHGRIITNCFGLRTATFTIDDQPLGIYDDATHKQAIPKIVAAAKKAEAAGVKALLISCAADPGVEECRQALSIPVIGAGSAASGIGLALGRRVGVLNLTGPTPPAITKLLGDRLVAAASPPGVGNTTHLLNPSGMNLAIETAQMLAQQADVIVFACTGYSTIGLAKILRNKIPLHVVDAVEAGGAVSLYHIRGIMDGTESR